SETIIDVDFTFTPLKSDSLNTKTSQTSIEPNIEQFLLYPQIDETTWSTFYTDNYNTKTQYYSIYSDITDLEKTIQTSINNQSDSDFKQFFEKAFTTILN
ncbi:24276_t:CDS:2, partial [Gigaspora margarita]